MRVGNIEIRNSGCEKLLGVKTDSRLNFNDHLDWILKKAGRKVNTSSRVSPYMNINKRTTPLSNLVNCYQLLTRFINLLMMIC